MQFAGGFYPGEMEKPTYYEVRYYDENGNPIQGDESGEQMQYDDSEDMSQSDESGNQTQYDEYGNPL